MNILIVEDEQRIAKRLKRMIKEVCRQPIENLHIENDLEGALRYLAEQSVDLVFLDLNLNGASGFDLLKGLMAGSFHTIIVSAHQQYAIKAFEYGVLDFIPKPFTQHRLEKAFQQMENRTALRETATKYLGVNRSGHMELIPVDDVLYIKGCGAYSELHLRNGKIVLHDKNMDRLLALLPSNFERIHKSYITPMSQVKAFLSHPGSRYEIELKDGTTLPIGRTRYKGLKRKFSNK